MLTYGHAIDVVLKLNWGKLEETNTLTNTPHAHPILLLFMSSREFKHGRVVVI